MIKIIHRRPYAERVTAHAVASCIIISVPCIIISVPFKTSSTRLRMFKRHTSFIYWPPAGPFRHEGGCLRILVCPSVRYSVSGAGTSKNAVAVSHSADTYLMHTFGTMVNFEGTLAHTRLASTLPRNASTRHRSLLLAAPNLESATDHTPRTEDKTIYD